MSELAGNLSPRRSPGNPTVVSEVVRLNPLYQVHGLTSCEPTPALNPRVGMSLTRTTALPNKLSESEMELTPPESSPLTRGAGRLNTTQRLEMSPLDKGHERNLQHTHTHTLPTRHGPATNESIDSMGSIAQLITYHKKNMPSCDSWKSPEFRTADAVHADHGDRTPIRKRKKRPKYGNIHINVEWHTSAGDTHPVATVSVWVRDVNEEGIEPHPGPRYLSKNINSIQGKGKLFQALRAIRRESDRDPSQRPSYKTTGSPPRGGAR